MEVQCTDNKTFKFTDDTEIVGQLIYDNIFSYKASAIYGSNEYKITPKGFFSTSISVTKHDIEVASMQMNWKGHIILSFQNGQQYILKAAGTFLNKYILEDKEGKNLMLLNPDFNWSKFNYNYTISYDDKPQDILLVLLAVYGANYYIAAMSGSMG